MAMPASISCPRCQQRLAVAAGFCDACGLTLAQLDDQFGGDEVVLAAINDRAGWLTPDDQTRVTHALAGFEAVFIHHFIAVHVGPHGSPARLRQGGFWLLNRAAMALADVHRPNENGLLILLDPEARLAGIVVGYQVEPWLSESDLRRIVEDALPLCRTAQWAAALERIVRHLERALRRAWHHAGRFKPPVAPAAFDRGPLEGLPRLRSGHGGTPPSSPPPPHQGRR